MTVHSPACAWQRLDDDEVVDCECQKVWPEVEAAYEDFWKPLVENPDGSLHVNQVKRELHDYLVTMTEVPKVYTEITRHRVSKPNTHADAVLRCVDEARAEEETWDNWFRSWLDFARSVGEYTPAETTAKKVREEMEEWLDEPSEKEAIDVIATLMLWCEKVGQDPELLLELAYERLNVWRNRTYEQQPDGTYHHVKSDDVA